VRLPQLTWTDAQALIIGVSVLVTVLALVAWRVRHRHEKYVDRRSS
jgi:ABC-type nickel/cobalt efflux system permease component RcnA